MARTLFAVLIVSLTLVGCKPKVGGRCNTLQTACEDGHTMLFCLDGKFTEMSCNGPDGCSSATKQADCDNTIAAKGDGCDEPEDLACTADKKEELRCRQNHFTVTSACKGPTGCFFTGNKLHCDTDLADLTDPCEEKDDLACSSDKKALYKCDGSKWEVQSTCKGPKGCAFDGTNVRCDSHVAEMGDACHMDGNLACTPDKKTLLSCRSGHFKKEKGCGKPCSYTDGDPTNFDCP